MMNVVHERDASKKWCPFSINPLIEQSTTGASSSTAVSVNRGHDLDNKCLGSMCMAWRWADERKYLGYCGLATSLAAPGAAVAGTAVAEAGELIPGLEGVEEEAAADGDEGLEIAQELRTCGLCARMKTEDVPEGYDGYCPIFDVYTKSAFQCDPTDDHWIPAEGVCGSCKHMKVGSMRDGFDGFCDKIGGYVRFTDDCPTGFWLKGTPTRSE